MESDELINFSFFGNKIDWFYFEFILLFQFLEMMKHKDLAMKRLGMEFEAIEIRITSVKRAGKGCHYRYIQISSQDIAKKSIHLHTPETSTLNKHFHYENFTLPSGLIDCRQINSNEIIKYKITNKVPLINTKKLCTIVSKR